MFLGEVYVGHCLRVICERLHDVLMHVGLDGRWVPRLHGVEVQPGLELGGS